MKKNETINIDSPKYNKRTTIKFTITMILFFIIGGLGGFFGAKLFKTYNGNFSNIAQWITEKLPFFQLYIIPGVLLILILVCLLLGRIWIQKAKLQITTWDGENDEHIDVADAYLAKISTMSNILTIFIEILFGLASYQMFFLLKTKENAFMLIFCVIIYFIGLFVSIFYQNQVVKTIKLYAPEKKGNIYDNKFQKVWYESCDEAERQLIGDASYHTFSFMNTIFSIFLTVTILVGLFIPIGFLCSFFIGILWLIMSCYYTYSCKKLEQGKSNKSFNNI